MNTASRISWRWRLVAAPFVVLLVVAMTSGYTMSILNAAPGVAGAARLQIISLTVATVAAAAVILTFIGVTALLQRLGHVTLTAEALAGGDYNARTGMHGAGEVDRLGSALDAFADAMQERHDSMRLSLRRQRREVEYLTSVVESLPDGVIVQDVDGRIVLMNDHARRLIGANGEGTQTLTALVTDAIGQALAPGLYALGDPKQLEHHGRMLSAQAAAIQSLNHQRVGTVIVVRDITDQVRRERARDAILSKMAVEAYAPLDETARFVVTDPRTSASASVAFARELARHSTALQKLIVEMRELTAAAELPVVRAHQRPLPLETLVWAVANEWRQVAQAANLTLHVQIEAPGLYVLGDERRLRWAIGNLVDNAIKYTPPGGALTLEIRGEMAGSAQLRVRDSGAGIAPDELPHVFTRFFRGTPTTEGGRVIRVPGSGQGLTIARQIIEAHGGSIKIKSTPGVGTAVYFALPLTAPVSVELPRLHDIGDMDGETVRITHTDSIGRPRA